jgi:enoyl-[acyl-carrier protein] reductase III
MNRPVLPTGPDTFDLRGRQAVVTGSSRGLGAACAVRLAEAGCDVVVTYRKNAEAAAAVAERASQHATNVIVQELDLESESSIDALFDRVESEWGGLDILVANAAATTFRPMHKAERRHFERTYAISVFGFHQMVVRSLPLMESRGRGRIVAVSGADTGTWINGHGILAGAKAAMESMVHYFGCELANKGITTVGISPGWIDGESLQLMLGPLHEFARDLEASTHPMRVAASPEHVAESVAVLCTDAAALFNGNTLVADGSGVFGFCARYTKVAQQLAIAQLEGLESADAPAIPE